MHRFVFFLLAASFCQAIFAAAAPPRFSTDIPFRDCDGLICVDVGLDGGQARSLMLDTGNANSTVLTEVAHTLGWSLQPVERDGQRVPGIYRGGEHRTVLGRLDVKENFFVFDRALLGEYKPPVDGSLAYDFFKDRVLQIDYPKRRLRISDVVTAPLAEPGDGTGTLKLIGFGQTGAPVIVGSRLQIDGKPVRMQIDTVFTGSLLVYDSALARLGLTKRGKPAFFGYTDGGVSLLGAPAPSVSFSGRVIAQQPTIYFVGEGASPVRQPDGLFDAKAGNALFAHSVITLDFHAMTLDVRPSN